jgi:hypothetical protein
VSNYELFCRLYIKPDLGRVKLDRLTVRDVQVWLERVADALPVLRDDVKVTWPRPDGLLWPRTFDD